MTVLLVALGGAAGAVLRLLVSRAVPGRRGTLLVNLAGSLLAGLAAGALTGTWLVLLGAGVCGGLTTFGTWADEVAAGVVDGVPARGWRDGTGYALLTAAGCLLACAAGLALAPRL